jgi:hypothetical protein
MSVASVAQLLQEQGGSGGGSVNDVIGGTGITVTADSFGDYTVDNDGVLELTGGTNITITGTKTNYTINSTGGGGGAVSSIIAGTGITIDPTTGIGDVTITSDVNPADYYTASQADGLFQTLTDMVNYSTTAQADALYQTLTDMANYSTTAVANGLYQTLTGMADYSTTAEANALYQTLTGMADYSTTAEANGLYAPLNSGVTSLTAGTGIGISASTGGITITNISSAPITTVYNLPTETPLYPVQTQVPIITSTTSIIPLAGTYIVNVFIILQSYNSTGVPGAYIGSGLVGLAFNNGVTNIEYINQPFAVTDATQIRPLNFSSVIVCDGIGYIDLNIFISSLFSGGTQFNVLVNDLTNSAPLLTLTQIG